MVFSKEGSPEGRRISSGHEVKFRICPKCRLAVRVDGANHDNECHGRAWKMEKVEEITPGEIEKEKKPAKKNPPGKRALRRAEAKAMKERPSISSSWNTDETKGIRSILPTPFESNRRKH